MSTWRGWIFFLTLLAGGVLTAWGLVQNDLLTTWLGPQSPLVGLVVLAGLATEAVARFLRLARGTAAIAVGAALLTLAGEPAAALTLALLSAACLVLGHASLQALRCDAAGLSWSLRLVVGGGLWGSVVGVAAHFPVAYPVSYGAVLLAAVIAGHRVLRTEFARLAVSHQPSDGWGELPIVLMGFYYLGVALMPEVGHDALATHLFVPAHLALRHEWGFDSTVYVWAVMPMLGDWLYGIGYVLAGETGARLVNLGAIFLASRLVAELAFRAGADRRAARLASLLFLSTPLVFMEASSLFIESVWSCFLLAASLALLQLRVEAADGQPMQAAKVHDGLIAAGLLAGCAMASKAVTFTALPGLILLMAAHWKSWSRGAGLRGVALAVLLGTAIGLVPYAWAWHVTGNPVFPFFNQIFRSPLWPPVAFEPPAMFDKGVRWDMFWRMTFDSGRYLEASPGASGFQWLLLAVPTALALALSRNRAGLWLLVFASVSIVLTFRSTAYLRYILPAFGWVAAAVGVAITSPFLARPGLSFVTTVAVAATVGLNLWFLRSGTSFGDFAPNALLGPAERERYLAERLPIRNLVGIINTVNDRESPVAVLGPPMLAGLAADALHASWYNGAFYADVTGASTVTAFGEMLDRRGVEYLVLDSAWGTQERRELARRATDLVAAVGSVELRRLQPQFQYRTELLRDAGLEAMDGWRFPGGRVAGDGRALVVDVARPAIQEVQIAPGRRYRLSVRSRCVENRPSQGRLQVNWLGRKGVVEVSIRPFDCAPNIATHSMVVVAPAKATTAVIYAVGHDNNPIVFEGLSFRQ